jgi:hypothetical protein
MSGGAYVVIRASLDTIRGGSSAWAWVILAAFVALSVAAVVLIERWR